MCSGSVPLLRDGEVALEHPPRRRLVAEVSQEMRVGQQDPDEIGVVDAHGVLPDLQGALKHVPGFLEFAIGLSRHRQPRQRHGYRVAVGTERLGLDGHGPLLEGASGVEVADELIAQGKIVERPTNGGVIRTEVVLANRQGALGDRQRLPVLAQLPQHDRLVGQRRRHGEPVNAIVAFEIGHRLIAVVHRNVVVSQAPLDVTDIGQGVADGAVIESDRALVNHHRLFEDRKRILVVSREHPGDTEDVEAVPDRGIGIAEFGEPDGIGVLEHRPRLEELTQSHVHTADEVLEPGRNEGLTLERLIDLHQAAIEDLVDGLGVAVGPRRVEPAEDPGHQLDHLLRSVRLTFRLDHPDGRADGAEDQRRDHQ